MFSPSDLGSRLKALRHRRRGVLAARDAALVGWFYILGFILIAVILVVGVSVYRFAYWNDIDTRLSERDDIAAYDETKLLQIVEEFDDRQRQSTDILTNMTSGAVVLSASSTIATSSESIADGE